MLPFVMLLGPLSVTPRSALPPLLFPFVHVLLAVADALVPVWSLRTVALLLIVELEQVSGVVKVTLSVRVCPAFKVLGLHCTVLPLRKQLPSEEPER